MAVVIMMYNVEEKATEPPIPTSFCSSILAELHILELFQTDLKLYQKKYLIATLKTFCC